MKRLVCLFLALAVPLSVLAKSPIESHNDGFYKDFVNPDECRFAITDVLSRNTPAMTVSEALTQTDPHPQIAALAQTISAQSKNDTEKITAVREYIAAHISCIEREDAPIFAPDVLLEGCGSAHGITNLTLALFHALDLPAIRVLGTTVSDEEAFDPDAEINHSWCEVLHQNTWQTVDTVYPDQIHVILRRGDETTQDYYYQDGWQYQIQNGGALLCGKVEHADSLILNIPQTLGGLPVLGIAKEAFANTDIAALTFPDTLKFIETKAFFHSRVPQTLFIPASVVEIGTYAFSYLNGLCEIQVSADNPAYTAKDGVLYDKEMTTLWVYPNGKTDTEFTVPATVTLLYCTCFSGNRYLTQVVLTHPEIKAMTYTFYGCSLTLYGTPGSDIESRIQNGTLTKQLSFLPQSQKDGGSFTHFQTSDVQPNFTDLSKNVWYYSDVITAYQKGLFMGLSDTRFGGEESITPAQAVTLSARIRNRYLTNTDLPTAEENEAWYLPAVKMVLEHQWFTLPDFDVPDRPATRAEFAQILAGALPIAALPEQCSIDETSIFDLPASPTAKEAILLLYRAGILTGDPDGRFRPDDAITRAEAAAVVTRLTDISRRIGFDPTV